MEGLLISHLWHNSNTHYRADRHSSQTVRSSRRRGYNKSSHGKPVMYNLFIFMKPDTVFLTDGGIIKLDDTINISLVLSVLFSSNPSIIVHTHTHNVKFLHDCKNHPCLKQDLTQSQQTKCHLGP